MNEAFRAIDAGGNQDEGEDDDGLVEMTDFYDPIAALLSSIGGEAENLTEELRKYEIKYEHLSGLCEEDLIVMGLKNKKIRDEVLIDIAALPNQIEHYDLAMKSINTQDYIHEVLSNAQKHLESMTALLTLTQLKISTHHVDNVQVEENKYASEVAVSVCEKLATKCSEIEQFVKDLKQGRFLRIPVFSNDKTKPKKGGCYRNLLLVSMILGCVYIGAKLFKPLVK